MRLLLTRPLHQSRELARTLHLRGHHVLLDPVLSVEPVHVDEVEPSRWRAALLTSANGARLAPRPLHVLQAFAVGEATAAAARKAGFPSVIMAEGDAASLARVVAANLPPGSGPLVHPCGADVRDGTRERFAEAGLEVEPLVVYVARAAASLAPGTRRALEQGSLDAVLLFSPRTARVFLDLVEAAGLTGELARIDAIAWSPEVAASCEPALWKAAHTVSQRDRATLLSLLDALRGGC